MDILLSFFFLIIASIIGILIGLFLDMKSYIKIAIIAICIFIPMELYNDYFSKINNKKYPNPNSQPNLITDPNIIQSISSPETTKYASVEETKPFEMDKPPFDGLEPKELLSRLNYIYYVTSNPQKPIRYLEYKTHADKLLDSDSNGNSNGNSNGDGNGKLSTNDEKLLQYSNAFYPQLTKDQIDTKDCLNYGSEKGSCFQNPSLFFNVKNDFNVLTKGVNENNANLLIREDFSNPMIIDPNVRYENVLFTNAPKDNLDRPLDQQSNEHINLDTNNSLCRNCKLAVCKNDYCGLQNNLFM